MDIKTEHGRAQLYASSAEGAALVRQLEDEQFEREYRACAAALDDVEQVNLDRILGEERQKEVEALMTEVANECGPKTAVTQALLQLFNEMQAEFTAAQERLAVALKTLNDVVYYKP